MRIILVYVCTSLVLSILTWAAAIFVGDDEILEEWGWKEWIALTLIVIPSTACFIVRSIEEAIFKE